MPSRASSRFSFFAASVLLVACGPADDSSTPSVPGTEALAVAANPPTESKAVASAPGVPVGFDLSAVPVSDMALPPFPWLDWPDSVPENRRRVMRQKAFDAYTLIAGRGFRTVEGRIEHRQFAIPSEMSQLEVRRTLAGLIRDLGGVPVSELKPTTSNASISSDAREIAGPDADVAELLDLHNYDEGKFEYEAFVIRTTGTTAWIVLQSSQFTMNVVSIEEQALAPRIGLVTADAMKTALEDEGRIALYLNFDTDAATLRPDSGPVLAEIAALLARDPGLRLVVEGHTDDTGTAERNRDLSQGRADAVVAALMATDVDASRLLARGLGAGMPLADNSTEDGRARNRRVELVRL